MSGPEIAAFAFALCLALFAIIVGGLSLKKGKLYCVPAEITRANEFRLWLAGVVIQLLTGVLMLLYCARMLQMFLRK